MKSHTPGPWRVGSLRSVMGRAFDGSEKNICDFVRGGSRHAAEANARLIAKAPELYDQIKELREALAGAMRVLYAVDIECPGTVATFCAEMTKLGIENGIGKRAEDLIAEIEGKP